MYALVANGRCEVLEFLREIALREPNLHADLARIVRHIADLSYSAPNTWFRRIHAWPGQWEVRKGDHRLVGFLSDDRLILCMHRIKKGQSLEKQDFRRVDSLRREWIDTYE